MESRLKSIKLVYSGFFISGFFVLAVGVIMPDLISTLGLSFTEAGAILSMFALGNLLSNISFPLLSDKVGRKNAVVGSLMTIPLGLISIVIFGSSLHGIITTIFLIMGIGRGSLSIVSNIVINDLSENKTKGINLLHTIWALGAFLSSFIILMLQKIGLSFDGVLIVITGMTLLMTGLYSMINYDYHVESHSKDSTTKVKSKPLDMYFFSVAILLFFYLGLENTINGWLMTYLKNMDVISESLAGVIVSVTWLMIMIGRVFTASIGKRFNGNDIVFTYVVGVSLMTIALLFANNQWVVFAVMLALGFFLAGIYPTSISNVSEYVVGNQKTMALILISAAIGGMLTPQIIGIVADKTSMVVAMNFIVVNIIGIFSFSVITKVLSKKA